VQLAVAARTDVGRIRAGNEDSLYADTTPSRGLFIVADGMGGHAAGEVASAMAVQIIARELDGLAEPDAAGVARMDRALREANRAIYERTTRESDKQGMGTTASVLVVGAGAYLIGQVGDSRVYRLREGALEQLTRDHSYVQEQVDAGLLTPEQAKYHPYSNVITRCVGANASVEPDVFAGDVRPGDVFLLASDGLTGMVDDRRLQQLLGSRAAPARVVDALIAEANGRGGLDNITAILVQVVAAGQAGQNGAAGGAAGDGTADDGTRGDLLRDAARRGAGG
jgi:protein phosphatase